MRHAADDGSFGRSAGGAMLRGALLLAIAVILGVVLLNTFDDGVTFLERPRVVEKTGANTPWLSPTRAASTSVPSRTIARSGLCSTAR